MLTWIFDLDNTLHDATPHIMPHINRSMTEYVQRLLAIDEAEATGLREQYWRRYGATLLGLMRHHDTDPYHFLWHTHQFPELARMVVADRAALHALRRLHGRKLVFSNAPAHYVHAVLDILGLTGFFDAVYTIEHTGYRPKPDLAGFRLLLRAEGVVPERAVMVDDMLVNLRAARRLGMATVWVSRQPRVPGHVDARIASIRELPRRVGRLRRASGVA
ncbi:MAG TPA: pyrimidine 5'-nucleotidase [Burkholderiales bacterium]|nr:pyrimidine 5'-nucleotidase [Burkholderiales bacterium]